MNPLTLVKRIQNINSKEASLGISEDASWHSKYKDSAYIFVGGIPFDLTEGDLLAVFAQYGEVVDVNLVRDKGTGKSKGFAFLAYEDQRSTTLAVDNLNGAQILGRIIRVDHVDKYKKKEEEDEETERQKREARGVCRAFQRGECTRGAGCKFSHDEQRAANTGWGHEDSNSKWDNDKFEGPKKERRLGNNQSNPIPETRVRDSRSRAHDNEKELDCRPKQSYRREMLWRDDGSDKFKGRENNNRREEKKSRRHEDDEFEPKSREDRHRREEKRSRRNDYDDVEPEQRDHHRREDKRSRKPDDVELEPRSRDSDTREDKRPRRHDDDDFGSRSRKHNEDEFAPRSREGYDRKHDSRSYRNDRPEVKVRYDDGREEKSSRR
ncbi:hypothetical protein RIF29_07528 [Crotalaria pallida]|uniref:Uncharacterized protein n=1 Tax=Crotalaria pallida TaxID=3830 RepID=A0AAN9J5E7_CROPI